MSKYCQFKRIFLFHFVICVIFYSYIAQAKNTNDFTKVLAPGYNLLTTGYAQEAVVIFLKKTKKYPNSAECHIALGKAYKAIGKISEAKNEFKTATLVQPDCGESYLELGELQESDQEWDSAIQSFKAYVNICPDEAKREGVVDRIKFCQEKLSAL